MKIKIVKNKLSEAFQIDKNDSSMNVLLKLIQHFADSKDASSLQTMRDFFKQENSADQNAQYLLSVIEQNIKNMNKF